MLQKNSRANVISLVPIKIWNVRKKVELKWSLANSNLWYAHLFRIWIQITLGQVHQWCVSVLFLICTLAFLWSFHRVFLVSWSNWRLTLRFDLRFDTGPRSLAYCRAVWSTAVCLRHYGLSMTFFKVMIVPSTLASSLDRSNNLMALLFVIAPS